jgi:cysteine synthase A
MTNNIIERIFFFIYFIKMDNTNVLKQIGNTPLIKLIQASELTGCNIYGKAEYFNPGESVKDRAALFIVEDAIKKKKIQKGGVIIEGSAGNTGIGLAVVAKAYGMSLKIVIPKTQSIEKKETLKAFGAELIEVDAAPYSSPNNYIKQSKKISDGLAGSNPNGVFWANQFDNIMNAESHIKTTSMEIWTQTAGQVDGFVCAVGTGGTLAGVSIGLKEKNKDIKIALSDPMGSSLFSHVKYNKLENTGSSITEGIGTGRVTKNFEKALVDDAFQVTDEEALNIIFKLKEDQRIELGGSSGINIAGAIKLAKKLGPGSNIVTILCDPGKRYASKIYNKSFLKSKNLPVPSWL